MLFSVHLIVIFSLYFPVLRHAHSCSDSVGMSVFFLSLIFISSGLKISATSFFDPFFPFSSFSPPLLSSFSFDLLPTFTSPSVLWHKWRLNTLVTETFRIVQSGIQNSWRYGEAPENHNCAHRVWKAYGICRSIHVACKVLRGVRLSRQSFPGNGLQRDQGLLFYKIFILYVIYSEFCFQK